MFDRVTVICAVPTPSCATKLPDANRIMFGVGVGVGVGDGGGGGALMDQPISASSAAVKSYGATTLCVRLVLMFGSINRFGEAFRSQ